MSINIVSANEKITKFIGSSYEYSSFTCYNSNCSEFIIIKDASFNINYVKNRYVEIWLLKNGEYINKNFCYNYDTCQIGNIKIKILNIFFGKEAGMIQFKILKVYR